MRFVFALATGISILVLVGCSSSDGREASLRETVTGYVEAFQDRDSVTAYDFNHDSYKEKCLAGASDDIFIGVDSLYGEPWDSAELKIWSVDIDGARATVDYDLFVDGSGIGFGEAKIFWLYEDGRWWRASDHHADPCGANAGFGSDFFTVSSFEEAADRAGYAIA